MMASTWGVLEEIASERRRQVEKERWSPRHDDAHKDEQLAKAAACYAMPFYCWNPKPKLGVPAAWPWDWEWWKPKNRRRDLVRAGALIVAEIERLDRAARRK